MLFGDLLTTMQERLPIKIVVYDNGKLEFADIEQEAAGLVLVYTELKNPISAKLRRRWAYGTQCLEVSRPRGVRSDLTRSARSSAAACEGETHAVGDATVTPRVTGGQWSGCQSTAPEQCCTAKATMFGKRWRRIFPEKACFGNCPRVDPGFSEKVLPYRVV
jgi:hypothetical protein